MAQNPIRLTLVTPARFDPARFAAEFEQTVAASDIAAVILDLAGDNEADWRHAAETLRPIAQAADAAFLVRDRPELARSVGCDGVHVTRGAAALSAVIGAVRPGLAVGAGDCTTRHAAMTLGEPGPDYVFLGRLDPEEDQPATPTLVEWWTELFEPPCIAMACGDWTHFEALVAAGADFIAVRDLVWNHPDGPRQAVGHASSLIHERSGALA